MRYEVRFSAEAQQEAAEAAAFIAKQTSKAAAERWYDGLEKALASLESMPARFGPAREAASFPDADLRQCVYGSHRMIFTIREGTVHVLHVRHSAQDTLDAALDDS